MAGKSRWVGARGWWFVLVNVITTADGCLQLREPAALACCTSQGICDPNKKCYAAYSWSDASNQLSGLLDLFLQKDSINDLVKFQKWYDPLAANAVRS